MTFLRNLLNPPPTKGTIADHYKFFNSTYTGLQGLTAVSNKTIITNPNFATLSAQGTNPTTPGDGDNFEFIGDWKIIGATAANYVITATPYPSNSTVKSASQYFVHQTVSTFNGGAFYYYQRQAGTVRQYQQDNFTFGLMIQNNLSKAIKLRMDINTFYDPTSNLVTGSTFFLQPGMNTLASTVKTQSLNNIAVGSGNYTEFRINFLDFAGVPSDIDLYQIKCEFGTISTPLSQ